MYLKYVVVIGNLELERVLSITEVAVAGAQSDILRILGYDAVCAVVEDCGDGRQITLGEGERE